MMGLIGQGAAVIRHDFVPVRADLQQNGTGPHRVAG
jgi:hypothetical protein